MRRAGCDGRWALATCPTATVQPHRCPNRPRPRRQHRRRQLRCRPTTHKLDDTSQCAAQGWWQLRLSLTLLELLYAGGEQFVLALAVKLRVEV